MPAPTYCRPMKSRKLASVVAEEAESRDRRPVAAREARLLVAQPPADRRAKNGSEMRHAQEEQRGRRDRVGGVGELDEDRPQREREHAERRQRRCPSRGTAAALRAPLLNVSCRRGSSRARRAAPAGRAPSRCCARRSSSPPRGCPATGVRRAARSCRTGCRDTGSWTGSALSSGCAGFASVRPFSFS